MDDTEYILDRIYRGWNINCFQYNQENVLQYYAGAFYGNKQPIEPEEGICRRLRIKSQQDKVPAIITEEDMIYYNFPNSMVLYKTLYFSHLINR